MIKVKIKNQEIMNELNSDRIPLNEVLSLNLTDDQTLLLIELFSLVDKPNFKVNINGVTLAMYNSTFISIEDCERRADGMMKLLNELIELNYVIFEDDDYYINLEKIYCDANNN